MFCLELIFIIATTFNFARRFCKNSKVEIESSCFLENFGNYGVKLKIATCYVFILASQFPNTDKNGNIWNFFLSLKKIHFNLHPLHTLKYCL